VPTYVIDAPGGGGKIPLYPPTLITRESNALVLKNYAGHLYQYPDPDATLHVPVEPAHA
jgi:lysine 2,3-aminomutase